jgi:hypothetical protein
MMNHLLQLFIYAGEQTYHCWMVSSNVLLPEFSRRVFDSRLYVLVHLHQQQMKAKRQRT